MMTIASIDSVGTPDTGNILAATPILCPSQGIAPGDADMPPTSGQTLPSDTPALSGLEELVADNEALGKALQSLVDAFDTPRPVEVDAESVPVDEKKVPADAKMAPADVKMAPADVKAVPADVKTVSADVKAAPADVKAAPADVKVVPADVKFVPAEVAFAVEGTPIPADVPGLPEKAVVAPFVAAKPEEAVVKNLLPGLPPEEKIVVVEKSVVREAKPVTANPERDAAVVAQSIGPQVAVEKPTVVDGKVLVEGVPASAPMHADARPVAAVTPVAVAPQDLAADAPIADAPIAGAPVSDAPVVETPVAEAPVVIARPTVAEEAPVVADKVVVADKAIVQEGPSAEEPAEDGAFVLQAAPMATVPVADVVTAAPVAGVESVAPVVPVAPLDVNEMFLAAADAVASAIEVSPALMRGEAGDIRVQLRPDVLAGSEVVISVDGKSMEVRFVPTMTQVADTIVSNQASLQQQLAARIPGFEVSVAVEQTVATNVAAHAGSTRAAFAAVNRQRKTDGRA